MHDKQTRGYCFTLNNYTDDEEQQLQQLGRQVQYLVYGRERGGEANTPHLQGYIHFNSPTSFNRAKELLPRAHVERRRGTIDQAIEYCKKIKMYMRKAEDRCLVKLEEPLDETSSSSSSSTHETETSTGLQNTIPNGSSLTTHGSRNSNYDNQEYWKGILQTNGGLDLLAQASQDYFGNNTQITTTSNSTNGGMDIMTKRPLLLRNGVPKTSALGPNLKSGPIGTHSALRSKVARCLKFDPQN